MTDKILDDISIDFDIKNHHELTPYVYFTQNALDHATSESYNTDNVKDGLHQPWISEIFNDIDESIYYEKYFGDEKEESQDYQKSIISQLKRLLRISIPTESVEKEFCHSIDIVSNQQIYLSYLLGNLKKKIKRDLRQMAIPTIRFPHFTDTYGSIYDENGDEKQDIKEQREKLKKDQENMKELLSKITEDDKQNQNKNPLSLNDLIQFNEILQQYKKPFTFSPSFIISCIQKLDLCLNLLIPPENKTEKIESNDQNQFNFFLNINSSNINNDEKDNLLKYYRLLLLIKMQLYMQTNKTNDFLKLLLELMIFDEKNQILENSDDQLSFKKIIDQNLPETKCRSKILSNVSFDEILDFSFSHDGRNDFILTKEGVFRIRHQSETSHDILKFGESSISRVEFNSEEENKKVNEILQKANKYNAKITVENGFLYLLCVEDKTIHKALIKTENEETQEKTKKNESKKYEKHEAKENETDKPLSNKKLREKAKKEKKRLRKNKDLCKEEINFDSVPIEIPDFPIISIGSFDSYIRVIQRKSSENGKTTFLFTNVDLTPNSRFNYDIDEAFQVATNTQSSKQTQIEIVIENRNKKFTVNDATFSNNSLFISFDDSILEQWMIFDDGTVSFLKAFTSPYIFTSQKSLKIDNNSFLYICQPIKDSKEKAVSFVKMHLPCTKYYLRSENKIFLEYPHLQKISDIVDNCSHLIVNRKPTTYFTSAEFHEVKDRSIFDDDDDEKKKKEKKVVVKNPFEFTVSPEEMGSIIQSVNSIHSQLDFIKSLISNLKDENLKRFFVSLFIKIIALNLHYGTSSYYTAKDKISESTSMIYEKFKEFIFDMFSLYENDTNSIDFEFMIRESIIVTFSLVGKFLFLRNPYDELHSFVHKILKIDDENNNNLKSFIRSISYLLFYYPSSMYIIDPTIYNELIKSENEINLHDLFLDSSLFTIFELRFSEKVMKNEFIENISPYFESLFIYINHLLNDESHPLIETEEILSYLFGIDNGNAIFALMIEKGLVSISQKLFERIQKVSGVVESDNEFYEGNKDISDSNISKVIKVIESEHPYNLNPPEISEEMKLKKEEKKRKKQEEKKKMIEEEKQRLLNKKRKKEAKRKKREERRKRKEEENKGNENHDENKDKDNEDKNKEEEENKNEEEEEDNSNDSSDSDYDDEEEVTEEIGLIDFGSDAGDIYLVADNRTKLHQDDKLLFYIRDDDYNPTSFEGGDDFRFNSAIKFESNRIRIMLKRKRTKSNKPQDPFWGYKLTFIGYTFENKFYWKPNIHLYFFNHFIRFLVDMYSNACSSTDMDESEREFSLILKENIIQGIKLEEIDNYEANLDKAKQDKESIRRSMKRTLTRGISRGINYDTSNDNVYDDQFKKSFINDILTATDDSNTLGKQLLDVLYSKTAKQNKIKLTQATKSILINERYLAACLFKQLGLINVCIHFIKDVKNNDEIPKNLMSLWRNIYSLRKTLFFEYQKSKSVSNSNSESSKYDFASYSEEVKRKCKLLLYSDPILKFKESGNLDIKTIESTIKSIFSFVTSKVPLSHISEIINIRRKRLNISSQSISLMASFMNNNNLFLSSKPIFAYMYENVSPSSDCEGVRQHELEDFSKQIGELSYKVNEVLLNEPSIAIISSQSFLSSSLFNHQDNESRLKSSKILIDLLEKNKQNKSFNRDRTNFVAILALLAIASKSNNNELVDYLVSLLQNDEIDLVSKKLLLLIIPTFKLLYPDNLKVSDKSLALSILSSNSKSPIIASNIFYWLAEVFNTNSKDESSDVEFIKKVLKGIGQAFIGKSCLFIDDSYQPFTHRQVSEEMISFIRILLNYNNQTMHKIIHEILSNSITKIKLNEDTNDHDENLIISLGLFASLCQNLSAIEPDRKLSTESKYYDVEPILGFNTTLKDIRASSFSEDFKGFYISKIMFNPNKVNLNDIEIKNILQLHENLSTSKYFTNREQKYDEVIKESEIIENILISSFYSFIPVILQNKNNAELIMNGENISRCLSLFNFAKNPLPSKENSFLILSHYLQQAINDSYYQTKNIDQSFIVDSKGSFRFLKMNFGDIFYANEKDGYDVIKGEIDHSNLFVGARPFDYSYECYFEIKLNKVGRRNVFLGFVDSEEHSLNKAFGFGCIGYKDVFCRRSPFLNKKIKDVEDKIMCDLQGGKKDESSDDDYDDEDEELIERKFKKVLEEEEEENEAKAKDKNNDNKAKEAGDKKKNDFAFNVGDLIGVYYTKEYIYLTINRKLTPYRLYHQSVLTYVPIIFIDHDEVELAVTENISNVDLTSDKYEFLKPSNQTPNYFEKQDNKSAEQAEEYNSSGEFKEKKHLIGQQVYISKNISAAEEKCKFESIESYPRTLLKYREQYGIIKEIIPFNNSRFVTKLKVESYNNTTLSKQIIDVDVDSRYVEKIETNFFNLIENQNNIRFGFNGSFDLNYLPQEYRNTSDFNKISIYLKNKTIKDNSKSIAILMTRYLAFILVDYLRYSKSTLLQDEGINSTETDAIIKSLAISLPSITTFRPSFYHNFDTDEINQYIIFSDNKSEAEAEKEEGKEDDDEKKHDDKLYYKPPGFNSLYNKAFKVFLKKSETFLSNQFLKKLIHESYKNADEFTEIVNSETFYEMIPSVFRIESISPLPKKFKFKASAKDDLIHDRKIIGLVPILISTIPDQLPCAKCINKRLRHSSDEISYFIKIKDYDDAEIKWKYDIEKLKKMKFNQDKSFDPESYKNYKLKFGMFLLSKYLDEDLLSKGLLGFIQTIYIILQMFNNSDVLYEKHKEIINAEFISNLFSLASKKNPIASPFLQQIIVSFISKNGLTDSILTHNISNTKSVFTDDTSKLFELTAFPNYLNELPLLFSIFSNLSQTRIVEFSLNGNNDGISSLFDKYYDLCSDVFKICSEQINKKQAKFIEGDKNDSDRYSIFRRSDDDEMKKKKNFRSLYLVYYYSLLLTNEINLPYPKFVFVHDWMMQHFGGFRKAIGYVDVKNYKGDKENGNEKDVEYKSEVIENEFDLHCSYKYISIYEGNDDESDDDDYDDLIDSDDLDVCIGSGDDDDDDYDGEHKKDEEEESNDAKDEQNEDKKEDGSKDKNKAKHDGSKKTPKIESYKVFIHQIKDDARVELPQTGESVVVSFPLEIIIVHENGKKKMKKKFKDGNAFIVDFSPSKEQEKEVFMNNYKEIEKNFDEFISLSQYDNKLSETVLTTIESSNENGNSSNENDNNNNNNNNNGNANSSNSNHDDDDDESESNNEINLSDSDNDDESGERAKSNKEASSDKYKTYEIEKIAKTVSVSLPSPEITESVLSLRLFAHSSYRKLIEDIIVSYTSQDGSDSSSSSSEEKVENRFMNQIISPAYSMTTESKFKFINQVLSSEQKDESKIRVVFNRFEQQKFMDRFNELHKNDNENAGKNYKARPLFVQFIEQVDADSIPLLKVHRDQPFSCDLVGEAAIDSGGPGRELFSFLIEELMNDHIGIFTFNPNRRHNIKETNQEDLIPNTQSVEKSLEVDDNSSSNEEMISLLSNRFLYAGALIAVCIVSGLPQPMKLSSIVWDYLTHEEVDIKSVYEIDNGFKELIETAESLQEKVSSNSINEEEFEKIFLHSFEIKDSFDQTIELIPSGSKTRVTKENLHEFIELANDRRLHEFDEQLKELKEGFDKIMTHKNITKILRPYELKLLVCGEPNCDIDQMKKLIDIDFNSYKDDVDEAKMKQIFWNVMKSFSVDERMLFIRFSSGNLGLPAPGLKWEENIKITVGSKDEKEKEGKNMVYAHTCFSKVDLPYYENEDELAKMLRIAIRFTGLITDSHENIEEIADYL